ncbi:unnamed protein product [Macrosiphum euphorbiae]|uniref:Uncharacterized protein n=1 Tax=Macrosiphum euphorbiae TaxID=13131 RepID=A0AAV0WTB1_9HEMI|nr:unnamed protein product [Macrosiphum euphorbiae]
MALEPENDPIIMYSGHNHRPGHDVEIGNFLDTLRSRAAAESTPPRIIYEEESRRFPNAATEMSVDVALRMMWNIRQRFNPPVPASLAAMGETIA